MNEKNLIKEKRCQKAFTISQLSRKTGIPAFILKSLEKGSREPSLEELHCISTVLDINPMSLVERMIRDREIGNELRSQ